MSNNKKIKSPITRAILFLTGLIMGAFLVVETSNWLNDIGNIENHIIMYNYDVTLLIYASVIVLIGILAGSFIKSGLLGKWKMD